jgi:Tripartite tricarboxylate transporter TctB family
MSKLRINLHDALFGTFLILVATAAMVATRKLSVGTASDMGPGYMPLAVALIILGFGVFLIGRGLLSGNGQGVEAVQIRPLLAIFISVGVFALLAERAGLVLASLATILIAGFGGREFRIVESILFACVLTACAVLLFVRVLALPIPIWPW